MMIPGYRLELVGTGPDSFKKPTQRLLFKISYWVTNFWRKVLWQLAYKEFFYITNTQRLLFKISYWVTSVERFCDNLQTKIFSTSKTFIIRLFCSLSYTEIIWKHSKIDKDKIHDFYTSSQLKAFLLNVKLWF